MNNKKSHRERRFLIAVSRLQRAIGCVVALIIILALTGCGKKESSEKPTTDAAAAQANQNVIILTKENLQNVSLKIEPVTRGAIETTLKAAGTVSTNVNKTAKIVTTLEGRLVKMNFDLNDRVKTGDVLALIETPELLGRPLELKAPIDGAIIDRKVTVGELVSKDKEIYTISDPTDLWVIAEIKERDIGAVKVGQDATFSVLAFPGEIFRGQVVRIGNQVQPESRTLEVRLQVGNADGRLKPGMFADVEITTSLLQNVIVIPEAAFQSIKDAPIVFVALDGDKFEKRVVKLGLQRPDRAQILEGVKEGERVVTDGSFILKSEMLKGQLQDKD